MFRCQKSWETRRRQRNEQTMSENKKIAWSFAYSTSFHTVKGITERKASTQRGKKLTKTKSLKFPSLCICSFVPRYVSPNKYVPLPALGNHLLVSVSFVSRCSSFCNSISLFFQYPVSVTLRFPSSVLQQLQCLSGVVYIKVLITTCKTRIFLHLRPHSPLCPTLGLARRETLSM